MTTKRAIKLIKNDIKYYKKCMEIMNEFSENIAKIWNPDGKSFDSMSSKIGESIEFMCKIIRTSDKGQIKYYRKILAELESEKRNKKIK